ncbi:hypothetical protein EHYA_09972 [Embleya hyalina]|uniref:Uncharacterized protein n=1 Tax=Embleya hyalina TaxID=516124 RepID=A0A401Z5S3_9ACTN|nr:hypothetical protein EHYA_09972 [Embleya hyalina]
MRVSARVAARIAARVAGGVSAARSGCVGDRGGRDGSSPGRSGGRPGFDYTPVGSDPARATRRVAAPVPHVRSRVRSFTGRAIITCRRLVPVPSPSRPSPHRSHARRCSGSRRPGAGPVPGSVGWVGPVGRCRRWPGDRAHADRDGPVRPGRGRPLSRTSPAPRRADALPGPVYEPGGPVVGAVRLTSAETVAVVVAAGCARIATQVMSRPGWAERLHVPAEAIDDAIDHAAHPDPVLEHLLGPRPLDRGRRKPGAAAVTTTEPTSTGRRPGSSNCGRRTTTRPHRRPAPTTPGGHAALERGLHPTRPADTVSSASDHARTSPARRRESGQRDRTGRAGVARRAHIVEFDRLDVPAVIADASGGHPNRDGRRLRTAHRTGPRSGDGYMYRMERVHRPVVVDRVRQIVPEFDVGVTLRQLRYRVISEG